MRRPNPLGELIVNRLPPLFSAAHQGDSHAALVAMRRFVAQLREIDPAMAEELNARTFHEARPTDLLRRANGTPADADTRAPLLRRIDATEAPRPVLTPAVSRILDEVVAEHAAADRLAQVNLSPRNTVLFIGPPGVGKTMTARWLARELQLPLAQIELSASVSSYLGRTGQNLREVLDFARQQRVVLLLDEFDAIAKRRDDHTDLGELKRTVSVLLKEIEDWPGPSVLVAATNHASLIDPAVFRRFQVRVDFGLPTAAVAAEILSMHLAPVDASPRVLRFCAELLSETMGSALREIAHDVRRTAAMSPSKSVDALLLSHVASRATAVDERRRFCALAREVLPESMRSLSRLAELLGVSKTAVHNYVNEG